jgi:DNA-binding NarL/FixJ family response regulator
MGWKHVHDQPLGDRKDKEVTVGDQWIFDRIEQDHHMPVPQGEHETDPYDLFPPGFLTDQEQAVIDAIVIAGLSNKEAARLLGCSQNTVIRHHRIALMKMREFYETDRKATIGGETE